MRWFLMIWFGMPRRIPRRRHPLGHAVTRILAIIALVVAVYSGFADSAAAAGTKGAAMGALDSRLLDGAGDQGIWQGRFEEDSYVLENRQNPNAVKYFYHVSRAGPPEVVSVNVRVDGGSTEKHSGGGLVFGFDPGSRSYYALVLRADRRLAIYKRGSRGLSLVVASPVEKALRPGFNELGVVRAGGKYETRLNGETISGIGAAGMGEGFGIVALGVGRFAFSNFDFGPAP